MTTASSIPVQSTPRTTKPSDEKPIALGEDGVWERIYFDAPTTTSEEKIQFGAEPFKRTAGRLLEDRGFTVKYMENPKRVPNPLDLEPDRKRYVIYAWVTREPVVHHFDVEDELVPGLLKLGYKLTE